MAIEAYHGVIAPLVTPITVDGKIDEKSANNLISFMLDNHTIPYILGTTAECPSIPVAERQKLVQLLINAKP